MEENDRRALFTPLTGASFVLYFFLFRFSLVLVSFTVHTHSVLSFR